MKEDFKTLQNPATKKLGIIITVLCIVSIICAFLWNSASPYFKIN